MGCCLVALLLAGAPRIALLAWWFYDAARIESTFGGWIAPVLGVILLPWTTIAYVYVAPGGVTTFEWVIVVIALLIDLGSHGGGAEANRRRRE
jgi:hypothetical protein